MLEPYEEPEGPDADVEALRFVFRTLTTPLDRLLPRTSLQSAVVGHFKAGDHLCWRSGRFPFWQVHVRAAAARATFVENPTLP